MQNGRRVIPGLVLLAALALPAAGRAAHHPRAGDDSVEAQLFKADGLQFVMPERWIAEVTTDSVRAGQWRIPAARGVPAGPADGELVVFYFGPGLGGTVQENVAGWRGSVLDASGKPVAGQVTMREAGGLKITEWVGAGTYEDPVPIAGIPPVARPGYELAAAVIEGPQGNLYWRLTGPEPLVTAALPLFRAAIDSVKPLPAK